MLMAQVQQHTSTSAEDWCWSILLAFPLQQHSWLSRRPPVLSRNSTMPAAVRAAQPRGSPQPMKVTPGGCVWAPFAQSAHTSCRRLWPIHGCLGADQLPFPMCSAARSCTHCTQKASPCAPVLRRCSCRTRIRQTRCRVLLEGLPVLWCRIQVRLMPQNFSDAARVAALSFAPPCCDTGVEVQLFDDAHIVLHLLHRRC